MNHFFETIEQFDKELFLKLNSFHNEWLDSAMIIATQGWFWMPVYLFFIYRIWKLKSLTFNRVALFIGFLIVIFLSDRISVLAFKQVFLRYRPCHNFDLLPLTHIVKQHCGGKYGFLSSHATNFMGMATYAIIALKPSKTISVLLIIWALFVCYTRIYLGVHYPLDIICGSLLGISIGFMVSKNILHYFIKSENFN